MEKFIIGLFISLFLINPASADVLTPEFAYEHYELSYVYQQRSFQEEDLVGDILLAGSFQKVPNGLFHILIGKRGEYYSEPYIEAYRLGEIFPEVSRVNGRDAVYLKSAPSPRNYY